MWKPRIVADNTLATRPNRGDLTYRDRDATFVAHEKTTTIEPRTFVMAVGRTDAVSTNRYNFKKYIKKMIF